MSEKLKPCPFCGADHLPFGWFPHTNKVTVACATVGCFVRELSFCTETEALTAWNRRHSPAPADAGLLATLTRDAAQLRCEHVNEHIAEDLEKVAAAITRLTTELAEARAERDEANARWEQIAAAAAHFKSRLNARENETPKPFWVLEYDHRYIVNAECNLSLNIASAAQFVTRAKADAWRRSLPHPYWGSSVVEHVFVAKESALACAAEKEADDQCARHVEVMRELNETRERLAAAEEDWADIKAKYFLLDLNCTEVYQAVGMLGEIYGITNDENFVRLMDILAYGETKDGKELLPFPPLLNSRAEAAESRLAAAEATLEKIRIYAEPARSMRSG